MHSSSPLGSVARLEKNSVACMCTLQMFLHQVSLEHTSVEGITEGQLHGYKLTAKKDEFAIAIKNIICMYYNLTAYSIQTIGCILKHSISLELKELL